MSKTFHCPNCGAPLQEPRPDQGIISCTYCHSSVIVPAELRGSSPAEPVLRPAESLFNLPKLAASLREAADLTRAGRREEAVQHLLEKLTMDETEAHQVIAQMEQGQIVQIDGVESRFSSQAVSLSGKDADQILELLQQGNQAQALQRYTQITGSGVEEAQQALAALQMAAPLLAQPIQRNNQQASTIAKGAASVFAFSSCLTIVIVFLVSLLTFGIVFWALVSDNGPLENWWLSVNPFGRERIVLSFGKEGIGNGAFNDPRNIAVDPQGNIYVSDYRTGRVQQFDPQGNFLNLWIEEGTVEFNGSTQPTIFSLAVSRDGILHIVHDGSIYRRNIADGSSLPPIQFEGISVQQVYLSSTGKMAIVANGDDLALLNANGELEWIIKDAIENAAGESELTAYLTGDGLGNFYLAGSFTESVFKYSPEGKFLNRFGSGGDAANQFRAINAIQVDSQGRIYVSDIKGIMVFNPDGQYLRTLPVPGVAFDMVMGQDDRLYLVTNQPRVLVYQFR
ncbi:MAG: hypothetical protein KatS3mg045_1793 [Bellilinea sp.]|nr:MAG: hypothetical protein KatS3mg045_1793 [Bellilinea sp.]